MEVVGALLEAATVGGGTGEDASGIHGCTPQASTVDCGLEMLVATEMHAAAEVPRAELVLCR